MVIAFQSSRPLFIPDSKGGGNTDNGNSEEAEEAEWSACKDSGTPSLVNSLSDKIAERMRSYQDGLLLASDSTQAYTEELSDTLGQQKRQVLGSYLNMPWRSARPDITLLIEIFLAVLFLAILYKIIPYLRGTTKPSFSKEQFTKAMKLGSTAFTVEEMAKVNLQVKAFQDYADYFKSEPFSPENSGSTDLMKANAIMPIFLVVVQFVVPPFVISYIIWFIIRFWPYVMVASWEFYLAMYSYFTALIEGRLGCKWYIRMVTGWSCRTPNFSTYMDTWRKTYVDRPMYTEQLRYVKQYHDVRHRYVEIPYEKYIELPIERYKVRAQFAKKILMDRTFEVFLKNLQSLYPEYYEMPRDTFYKWILGNNEELVSAYATYLEQKGQESEVSESPEIPDKQEISEMPEMPEIPDSIFQTPTCETVDHVVRNKGNILRWVVGTVLFFAFGLVLYSNYIGTPRWLQTFLTPVSRYIQQGANVILSGRNYSPWLVFYGTILLTLLGLITL